MTEENEEKFTQLRTMLPVDVYLELTEFAKKRETFTGAWDYGNAIKELLLVYKVFYNVNTRIDVLEDKLNALNVSVSQIDIDKTKQADKEEKKDNPYGLLGKRRKEDGTN